MKYINKKLISCYASHLTDSEKSPATIEKYLRDVTAFMVWLSGRSVEKQTVLEYKEHLTQQYAPASVNSVISSLNSFFTFNEWYSMRVKSLKIQRRIFAQPDRELTKIEYEKLLSAAKRQNNRRLYLLMQTICSTGIRVSEDI